MTIEVRENIIGRLTEVRGLLEAHGVAAALPRLERHIQDLQEMPAPRSLSSLTEEEARECYRLAFGNDYVPEKVIHHQDGKGVSIWTDDKDELEIFVSGVMCGPNSCYGERPVPFNAAVVVRYLGSIGIALGAE